MPALGNQINATSITSTSLDNTLRHHAFTLSDAYKVAFWASGGNTYYSTRSSGGAWAARTQLVAGKDISALTSSLIQISDTIYVWYISGSTLYLNTCAWSSGSHSFTSTTQTTFDLSTVQAGATWADMDVHWDSTHSYFYLGLANSGANPGLFLLSLTTALVKGAAGLVNGVTVVSSLHLAGASSAASTIYLTAALGGSYPAVGVLPITTGASGAYTTSGNLENAYNGNASNHDVGFDGSNNLMIAGLDTRGPTLYAVKRTGTSTYSGAVTLFSNTVTTTTKPVGTQNGADWWVFFQTTANQANGEIYVAKLTGGAWTTALLAVGNDASGYASPSVQKTFDATPNAVLNYIFAGNSIYEYSVGTGSTPNTPVVLAPSGNEVGLTPTIQWSYSNPVANDAQGAYEVLVKRVSDSVTFWDSGYVSSSAQSVVYAGTALVNGTQYQTQVRVKDAVNGAATSYSPAVNFTPVVGPTPSIMSVAAGGVTNKGTASSTLASNTLAAATSLTVQAGDGSKFTHDNSTKVAVGASGSINYVTVSALSTDTLTVSAMADAHSSTQDVIQDLNTIASLLGNSLVVTVQHQQASGNAADQAVLQLYESDGVTLVTSTTQTLSPSLAVKTALALTAWVPATFANSHTYKLRVGLRDGTTAVTGYSPFWTITTAFTPPAAPSAFTAVPNDDLGSVALAWTNGSPASNKLYRRLNAGPGAWLEITPTAKAGTVFTSATDFPAINTAYDYAVTALDTYGNESTKATASNKTLGLRFGAYGHWYNLVSDPANVNVAMGAYTPGNDAQATKLHHSEDSYRYTPKGRKVSITTYGIQDEWSAPGRVYFVPNTDQNASGSLTQTDTQVIAAIATLLNQLVLYRDTRSNFFFGAMENHDKQSDADLHTAVNFDVFEQDTTLVNLTI